MHAFRTAAIALIAHAAQALLPGTTFASVPTARPFTPGGLAHMPIVAPAGQDISTLRAALANPTVLVDVPQEPHLLVLEASPAEMVAADHYRALIERSLSERGTVVILGAPDALAAPKPKEVHIWPHATTLVVTSRMGTRVDALRGEDGRDEDGQNADEIVHIAATHVARANAAGDALSHIQAGHKRPPILRHRRLHEKRELYNQTDLIRRNLHRIRQRARGQRVRAPVDVGRATRAVSGSRSMVSKRHALASSRHVDAARRARLGNGRQGKAQPVDRMGADS
ncbi:hypothetical protein [Burkholderia sp. AW49-1]